MDWPVFLCPLIAFCLYYNTLDAGFVYDDRRAILANRDVSSASSTSAGDVWRHDFWGTPLNASASHGSYRPLIVLSFRWTAQLAGLETAYGFHLVNVVLHCVVTAIVTRLASRMALTERCVSGLLFASHPIHCEAVAGLVGRADLVCCLFFLIGVSSYTAEKQSSKTAGLHDGTVAVLLWTVVAWLAKEYGIMLPIVCIVYDLFTRQPIVKRTIIKWLIMIGWCFFLVVVRLWLSNFRVPRFAKADNPVAHLDSWSSRTMTFFYLPVFHFGLLLNPHRLSFDWSMDAIQPIASWRDGRNLSSLIFYSSLLHVVRRVAKNSSSNWKKRVGMAVTVIVVPFLPATNAVHYVGLVAAERLLYLPSVGFCYLVAIGFQHLQGRCRKKSHRMAIRVVVLAVLCLLGWRTVTRNRDWFNEERLYRSGIAVNPAKAYGNLGVALQETGRFTEAEWSFKRALIFRPNSADVHHNLGYLFQRQGRYQESLRAYNRAIHYRPQLAESYTQKAQVLVELRRWYEAEETLIECTRIQGNEIKDQTAQLKAKALAAVRLAELTSRNISRVRDRERWLHLASQLAPQNTHIHYQLGELLAAQSRFEEAANVFQQGLRMDPESLALTVALAHALHDANRDNEAEVYFRQAVRLNPTDVSHQNNLGAVLHVQGKLSEAETVYERVLQLAPNHPLTTTNLQRLRNSWKRSHQQQNKNQTLT